MEHMPAHLVAGAHVLSLVHHFASVAHRAQQTPFLLMDLTKSLTQWPNASRMGRMCGQPDGADNIATIPQKTIAAGCGIIVCSSDAIICLQQQWLPVFLRMMAAMHACGMQDMQFWITYLTTLLTIVRENKPTQSGYFRVLYDDTQRQEWAHRAQRGEGHINLLAEAASVQQHILKTARARLTVVLQALRITNSATGRHA